MRKVRLSSHAIDRWNERVGLGWAVQKIADHIYHRFIHQLRLGAETYVIDGILYTIFMVGKLNEKITFAVMTPDSEGMWSGWTVVTFLTDDCIDDISAYFAWLKELGEEG